MQSETLTPDNLPDIIKKRIYSYLSEAGDPEQSIKVVYLFGSALDKEKFKDKSDIDLAFLIDPSFYKQDPLINSAPAYMAATEIGMMLNRKTDVIILNSASIETTYQAVTSGKVIYETDHENRLEYEAAIRGLYFDFKPFLDTLRNKADRVSNLNGKEPRP